MPANPFAPGPVQDINVTLPLRGPSGSRFASDPAGPPSVGRQAGAIDEAELIERCKVGDRAAQEQVYRAHIGRVYGVVARISGAQDAEELCQEIFLKIFRAIGGFRGQSALGTWIYRLAVNTALSHVTRRPRERSLDEDDHVGAHEEMTTHLSPRDPRLHERLLAALDALPGGYRAVLVLHDLEGQSHEEIAEILACSVGTSKSQLHKARVRMRELLGPQLGREVRS
jgi:RNA polymerase sigma-70 factor (ECF subfamily)